MGLVQVAHLCEAQLCLSRSEENDETKYPSYFLITKGLKCTKMVFPLVFLYL